MFVLPAVEAIVDAIQCPVGHAVPACGGQHNVQKEASQDRTSALARANSPRIDRTVV